MANAKLHYQAAAVCPQGHRKVIDFWAEPGDKKTQAAFKMPLSCPTCQDAGQRFRDLQIESINETTEPTNFQL